MQYEQGRFQSKSDTKEYLENYDKIFGQKIPWWEKRDKEVEDVPTKGRDDSTPR